MNKWMRGASLALAFLIGADVRAATYYVIPGTVLSTSGSDSGCNGLTNAVAGAAGVNEPNCAFATLSHAITVANGVSGSTINVTGTETAAAANGVCTTGLNDGTSCTIGGGQCTGGGVCRTTYATVTAPMTIVPTSNGTYTLDLNNLFNRGISITADNVVIGSLSAGQLTITGKHDIAKDSGGRTGAIDQSSGAGLSILNVTVNGNHIDRSVDTISSYIGIGVHGTGLLIDGCHFTGAWNWALLWNFNSNAAGSRGGRIRNSTWTPTGDDATTGCSGTPSNCSSTIEPIVLEHIGPAAIEGTSNWLNSDRVAVYNNVVDLTGVVDTGGGVRAIFIYTRPTSYPLLVWNNRITGKSGISGSYGLLAYFQDHEPIGNVGGNPWTSERYYFFNNTIKNVSSGNKLVDWEDCIGATTTESTTVMAGVHLRGNIFMNSNTGIAEYAGCIGVNFGSGANPGPARSARDTIEYNLCYNATSPHCVTYSAGTAATKINNLETTTNPGLTADLHLSSGTSNAIAAGSNNPLGQGAGVCSVVVDGETINCALDIDGDTRTTNWDAGADQFATTCGNNVREGSEACDGSDLAGKSCADFGYCEGLLLCATAGDDSGYAPCSQFVVANCDNLNCTDQGPRNVFLSIFNSIFDSIVFHP